MSGDAVLTDLRHLARLPSVLLNYVQLLPPAWTVHFIHGDDNHHRVRADPPLQQYLQAGRLQLRSLRKMAPEHFGPAMQARDLTKNGQLSPLNRATHLKCTPELPKNHTPTPAAAQFSRCHSLAALVHALGRRALA